MEHQFITVSVQISIKNISFLEPQSKLYKRGELKFWNTYKINHNRRLSVCPDPLAASWQQRHL